MDILWSTKELRWDDITIPMQTITSAQKSSAEDEFIEQVLEMIEDLDAVREATERANYILDAKYKKANLNEILNNYETNYRTRYRSSYWRSH